MEAQLTHPWVASTSIHVTTHSADLYFLQGENNSNIDCLTDGEPYSKEFKKMTCTIWVFLFRKK